ncbi:AAA family ATPase [Nonomuraea phyllanthi]|uniref:DNA 3'-5' helicase n=1 Tax=Nonomuraea phyllanthi TaxID=2219224 RepID=A0A5C4WW37_9ACTN|nr:UvrD-helicase domain-containing protein [Nonomuraea phyllanthi]KAB8197657.1 AAA family ATPase [Nonomuraea phyllanthi]
MRPSLQQSGGLTDEQLLAAAAIEPAVFIEAAPGSGKTTVAAERYGFLHYNNLADSRATVALSFTRAATRELRNRVARTWGLGALRSPNRVVTIDTLLSELLSFLLDGNHLRWPGGHTDLRVLDGWDASYKRTFSRYEPILTIAERKIVISGRHNNKASSNIAHAAFREATNAGICTHEDVRSIIDAAFGDAELSEVLVRRIQATIQNLIVDEIFDANRLDLRLIGRAISNGVNVTVIGDPWQALYLFRGAGPHLVPRLVEHFHLRSYQLTRSFRFITEQCVDLARDLRAGKSIDLPIHTGGPLDMVLARKWDTLWEIGGDILPLSFGSPRTVERAAALLLLDIVTTSALGRRAVFTVEALATLGITDPAAPTRLDPQLFDVLTTLRSTTASAINDAWDQLVKAVQTESPRQFRDRHATYTRPLSHLRSYLQRDVSRPVPAVTVHQAKGREWPRVGVRLTSVEKAALSTGLNEGNDDHRIIYVALTRGKSMTVAI